MAAALKRFEKAAMTSLDPRAPSKKVPSNKTARKNAVSKHVTQWPIQRVFNTSIQVQTTKLCAQISEK